MAKRVYFAFHYQDVLDFRANVVRNHNLVEGVESAGYYDHSIWEEAKSTSPSALKRLIGSELRNTTVTVVLIGSGTWARRWVRYEIFRSLRRGNHVFGIHINSIEGKNGETKPLGPNPFNYLAFKIGVNGTLVKPMEWKQDKWGYYSDLEAYAARQQPVTSRGKALRLSHWCLIYDWIADDGYENFNSWIG